MDLRFYGNGFIQVTLNPVTRMHIYSPDFDFKRVSNARIHDHKFFFVSQVLLGTLHHVIHEVVPTEDGPDGLYKVDESQPGEPLVYIQPCRVGNRRIDNVRVGEAYKFGGPGAFHDTFSEGEPSVTVMTKIRTVDGYRPNVVSLRNEEPDNAFGTQPTYEDMHKEVQRILALL
jgi:hypothetical protein